MPATPNNGYFVNIPTKLVDKVTLTAACNSDFILTSGGVLTCVNGTWEGELPKCTCEFQNLQN